MFEMVLVLPLVWDLDRESGDYKVLMVKAAAGAVAIKSIKEDRDI